MGMHRYLFSCKRNLQCARNAMTYSRTRLSVRRLIPRIDASTSVSYATTIYPISARTISLT